MYAGNPPKCVQSDVLAVQLERVGPPPSGPDVPLDPNGFEL